MVVLAQNHPVCRQALKSIMRLIKDPPSTNDELAEKLYSIPPYCMHDSGKGYLFERA